MDGLAEADETLRRRLAFLEQTSILLAGSLDYGATLTNVARLAVPLIADYCIVDVLAPGGQRPRQVAVVHVDPARESFLREMRERYPPLEQGPNPGTQALATGRSVLAVEVPPALIDELAQNAEHRCMLLALDVRSYIGVPVMARERAIGSITICTTGDSERRLGPDDLALAEDLARRAGLAVDNARLYAEATDAIKARDEFVSIASHELRSPITSISAQAELLLRSLRSGRQDTDYLTQRAERLVEQTVRLRAMITDLLDVARIRSGQLALRTRSVDLTAQVRAAVERYREGGAHGQSLTVAATEGDTAVEADPIRLDQVLTNLLDNAARYGRPGGQIEVEVAPTAAGARVAVRDQGVGLAPGALEVIFEPFTRGPGSASRWASGMGMGLYVCRQIVERHGGRIWAESGGEGRGATFAFELPRARARPPADI